MPRLFRSLAWTIFAAALAWTLPARADKGQPGPAPSGRTIVADVVAINQPIVYNRFGSANPWGMIYALRSQVEGCERDPSSPGGVSDIAKCQPGKAMLRASVRPRPLVLRVNAGDRLVIRFQNLLMPLPSQSRPLGAAAVGNVAVPPALVQTQTVAHPAEDGLPPEVETTDPRTIPDPPNDPATRLAGIAVVGLRAVGGQSPTATGLAGIAPGASTEYTLEADKQGSYFFSSLAAVQGGEGDGGSLTHGLFGMVIVEPRGARTYRSQISGEDMACLRNLPGQGAGCQNTGSSGIVNYEATRNGVPVAAMHSASADGTLNLVHSDLTAIVVPERPAGAADCAPKVPSNDSGAANADSWRRPVHCPFREFSIVFHDELKTVHAPNYAILNGPAIDPAIPGDNLKAAAARHKQLVGARDGFAINYGASGMGTALISNRAGIGPARNCVDCAYEEFFLQSWANGDPALLPQYASDPSNVYHSYLGDPVAFHNVHAGPKETHVFHLHAHQWLSQDENAASNYLDSQTIGPFQSFNYNIEYGGSGNRNLGPGDSIFHCHLYPHFAQGMWGLWRSHDVFEDGTRYLPDGGGLNPVPGTALMEWQGPGTDPSTGQTPLVRHANGMVTGGTPIPAIVPLPAMPLAPTPTYAANGMPGYPFYIPGKPGFRAPQPPLDMAKDGGLPRHLTGPGRRTAFGQELGNPATAATLLNKGLAEGDLTFKIEQVSLQLLPQDGTALEKAAMAFHAQSSTAQGFRLNGRPAAPGAPFGNPCPANAPGVRYNASIIETNLLVNRYGWHDPQARINVLDADLGKFQWNVQRSSRTPQVADPFFFRVHSGDCVTFQHTNRTPGKTGRDAFQVAAPTDIVGQHIHLVKFDVTASDGSANGFNYEDGTLSPDIIEELIHAASVPGGSITGVDGSVATLAVPGDSEARYQATLQRWWADPRLDRQNKDQTLGTVFTHDHFAPSNIQQHGFYNALLVEPRKSRWLNSDGSRMKKLGADGTGAAVGTQAIIQTPTSAGAADFLTGNKREFALAIADFALLYDGSGTNPNQRIDEYPAPHEPRVTFAARGRPIVPAARPEAISVDHHDPFLFNYKLEPMPVRMGDYSRRWEQWPAAGTSRRGDAAYAFSSSVHRRNADLGAASLLSIDPRRNHADGDPSTEIFEAYVGEKALIRLIQGAQEVQHVFQINGLSWPRQPGDRRSPIVASQETGISEHFEVDIATPLTNQNLAPSESVDFAYSGGTVDAWWNGAWGLIRSYPVRQGALDPGSPDYWDNRLALINNPADTELRARVACRLADVKGKRAKRCNPGGKLAYPDTSPIRNSAGTFTVLQGDFLPDLTPASGMTSFRLRKFCVSIEQGELIYNRRERLYDPVALRYMAHSTGGTAGGPASPWTVSPVDIADANFADRLAAMQCEPAPTAGGRPAPLVLRMNAGDFALVELTNPLARGAMRRESEGNSVLPPIVPSSGPSPAGDDISDRTVADRLVPSEHISLVPQLVARSGKKSAGLALGTHDVAVAANGLGDPHYEGYASYAMQGGAAAAQVWFAGTFTSTTKRRPPRGFKAFTPFRTDRGQVASLTSLGDPVKHAGMGLVGALVIEPAGATWSVDADDPTQARVTLADGRSHREAILVYQDGLNLKTDSGRHRAPEGGLTAAEQGGKVSVPDCHICDDTYDSGDHAVNYRTEPFWARLNVPWRAKDNNPETAKAALVDLNAVEFPADIWTNPVGGRGAGTRVETPIISAAPGDTLVIHAVHPGGRARQRAFVTYGHRYEDMALSKFGSPNSALLAPRKSITAIIDRVEAGCWLWRDGPAQFVGGGAWGLIEANADGATNGACPVHD